MIKEIVLTVFYIAGPFAPGFQPNGFSNITYCRWLEPIQNAAGRQVRIDKYIKRDHFAPGLQGLDDWMKLNKRTFNWLVRQPAKGVRIAFLPPLVDLNGIRYFAGLSQGCRPKNGLSVVNVQETRSDGTDGVWPSIVTVVHELGHTVLGATHDDELIDGKATYMNSAAGSYTRNQSTMRFSAKSLKQGRTCLKVNGL